MDSTYIDMAVPNCPSEVGQCNDGPETMSSSLMTSYSSSPPLMHTMEPSLEMMNTNLEPDSSKDMPPPSTIPGLAQFTTVEFSGFAQMASETNEAVECKPLSGSIVTSAAQLVDCQVQGASNSAAVQGVQPQQDGVIQYVQQSHVLDQRPGSVSASPGPSGSCGSGGSPAPSTSLSHPSVGSPWSFDTGCLPNSDSSTVAPSLTTASASTVSALPTQSTDILKTDKPQPPKKPLTPYMRFSKSIWQQVKAAHPTLSVCEVGAAIGKLWREMVDTEKQRYNDDFAIDKVRYDDELQSYLKLTGLQASDLTRPKAKKKDSRDKPSALLRPTKPQTVSFETADQASGCAPSTVNRGPSEPMTTTVVVSGGTGDALRAAGYQTVGVNEECSGLGTNLGALPHFSQVWAGQEVYTNPQLLTQISVTAGQTIYTNQSMNDGLNTSGLIAIHSHDVNQNEGTQVATLYSGQSQPLQNIGNQGVSGHLQMSVGLTPSMNQIDSSNVMTSSDNAWLWQQYNAGNQFVQDTTQTSLPQSQNHEGVIIYQLTSDGAQNSLVHSSVETGLQTNQNLPNVMLAKSAATGNGSIEATLEPGEVPISGQLQTAASNGSGEPRVYDLNQLCGLTPWNQMNQVKDEKMGEGFVQPVDGEKQLLRSALLEKSKEIHRLTRELELAYGLIHQLKQQNDLYQRHWNGQQQQHLQQQLQQQQLQQQLQQQQQQLQIVPKTEAATGLSIST